MAGRTIGQGKTLELMPQVCPRVHVEKIKPAEKHGAKTPWQALTLAKINDMEFPAFGQQADGVT
jgi:hypothetical protein